MLYNAVANDSTLWDDDVMFTPAQYVGYFLLSGC